MASLENLAFLLDEATVLTGVPEAQFRSWIDRYRLLAGGGLGRGKPRLYSLADLFDVRAVRALVEEGGITALEATKAINPFQIIRWLYSGQPFIMTRNKDGFLVDGWSNRSIVRIELQPEALYHEMRPRFFERYPEHTFEFEWKLAELREKQKRKLTGDD